MEKNTVSTYNMQEILPAPPPTTQTQTLVQEKASICVKFEFQT